MSIAKQDIKPRPPIQVDPLPQAGESLRFQVIELIFGRAMVIAITSLFVVILAAIEWGRYLFHVVPTLGSAVSYSVLATIGVALAVLAFRRMLRTAHALKLGLRGEQHIGRYLDDICRGLGYRVLHDIPGSGFNVDHVIIGPGGVFSIETKSWTKPPKGTDARMSFDGAALNKPDGTFDAHAPAQARANADFVRKLLSKRTARETKSIRVFPVLLIPGWYIDDQAERPRGIWVLGDDALHTFLPNEPKRLPGSDVALFFESLAEYSRNFRK